MKATYVVLIDCPGHSTVRVFVEELKDAEALADIWRRRGCHVRIELEGHLF